MSKTYEELAVEEYPKSLLPLDDGKHCPPFEATLYRYAFNTINGVELDATLREISSHRSMCPACNVAIKRYTACIENMKNSDKGFCFDL